MRGDKSRKMLQCSVLFRFLDNLCTIKDFEKKKNGINKIIIFSGLNYIYKYE